MPRLLRNLITELVLSVALASLAHASEPAAPVAAPVLCGTIQNAHGTAQMLDASRTQVLSVLPKTGVPCGAWISSGSTEDSWVVIQHRDGYTVHVASNSFVQIPDNRLDGKTWSESFVLYRGEVLVRSRGGSPEAQILTANARVRLTRGMAMVIYSPAEEETQSIALEGSATIENRYQDGTRMKVAEGEASSLGFKLLRVMPSTPKAVMLSALREKLKRFPIDDQLHSDAMAAAYKRQERKFASILGAAPAPVADHGMPAPKKGSKPSVRGKRAPAAGSLAHAEEEDAPAGRAPASHAPASQPKRPRAAPAPQKFPAMEDSGDSTEAHERARLMEEMSRLPAD